MTQANQLRREETLPTINESRDLNGLANTRKPPAKKAGKPGKTGKFG